MNVCERNYNGGKRTGMSLKYSQESYDMRYYYDTDSDIMIMYLKTTHMNKQ